MAQYIDMSEFVTLKMLCYKSVPDSTFWSLLCSLSPVLDVRISHGYDFTSYARLGPKRRNFEVEQVDVILLHNVEWRRSMSEMHQFWCFIAQNETNWTGQHAKEAGNLTISWRKHVDEKD